MTTQRMNKAQRQHLVTTLLGEHRVTSQSQLLELLAAAGVDVNVSTISRDLEELGAIKIRVPGGEAVYAVPELPREQVAPLDHLRRVLADWVVDINRSGDLVVLRTPPGSAHVVASAVDRSNMERVIGTVAGDDTVLLVASEGDGATVAGAVTELAGLL